MRKITVIGVPMWLGQTHLGTHLGPDAIRAAGLVRYLHSVSSDVIDIGNLDIKIVEPCYSNVNSLDIINYVKVKVSYYPPTVKLVTIRV